MKRIYGLILFWTGIGMLLMIFLPVNFYTVCLVLFLLVLGYNLFCG